MQPEGARARISGGWLSGNLWARTEVFEGNAVKQLLVPTSIFTTVSGTAESLQIQNNHGVWPASTPDRPLGPDLAWARLPLGVKPGDRLSHATWQTADATFIPPEQVLRSYKDAITYNEGTGDDHGLRAPQLGAVHAVLGYWTTKRSVPATVVMPTGTGKTETMLALLVAARPERLLVLVPSDPLREQVSSKFERLGILQERGIVSNRALRPVVGRVQHGFSDPAAASAFARLCNVIVATPQALKACDAAALQAMIDECSHLFIDEAHHVAARTWSQIRSEFANRNVVQFTATPFREDGRHLQGRIVYAFPLREAQSQGYFSPINYTAVLDFDSTDRALAEKSVAKLREDLAAGFDHVLMVRVSSISRANEITEIYDVVAGDLAPVIINSQMAKTHQRESLKALHARTSRIIVCVNMLGEGFDLPALKVAAVHDPQKSLGITLQFIGRFARTSDVSKYGEASIFVARTDLAVDLRLRSLYAEDSDWNLIVRDLTEAAVEQQQEISDFEEGFTSLPDDIALRTLLPKMSTVVYRAPSGQWHPENIAEFFGEENLLTFPIGLNAAAGVAWCVIERRSNVRWGDIRTLEETSYELYVLYFDSERQLLYINNSANDGVFEDLAEAVLGPGATRFTGSTVYRVMADIDRLVPTNVGVLDARDQFRRFSMHVGPDVTASFSQAEAGTKSQTNISGGGYRGGEHVSISASLKGRIWSHATASSLKHWCDWCDTLGSKLRDDTISIERVIGQFILPEVLKERPSGTLLAVEWPWAIHLLQPDNLRLSLDERNYPAVYCDLVPDTESRDGPFRFHVRTSAWTATYEAAVEEENLRYRCVGPTEVTVLRAGYTEPLSEWFNSNGMLFILDDDRIIEDNLILKPTWDRDPYDRNQLTPLDWTGTDITVESQTSVRLTNSIQWRTIRELKAEQWDVVLDDDGTGEIADIVAMRVETGGLLMKFVHCKYSKEPTPGARVADLYEVCGQAQKSIIWRRSDLRPFFKTLEDRARRKQAREGVSPFEVGDPRKLYEIQEKATVLRRHIEMVIVQPGLSVSAASTQQLDLLASTQSYLRTTIGAPLEVWCSA